MKKNSKIIIGVIALLILIIAVPRIITSIKIDKCIDNGGSWNYETKQCETESSTEETSKILKENPIKEDIIFKNSIGTIKLGMSIDDFLNASKSSEKNVKKEFISLEGDDYDIYNIYDENNKVLYAIEPSCDPDCSVWRIWIYGETLKTEKGIGVGNSLGELLENYEIEQFSTEEGVLVSVKDYGYRFILNTADLSNDWWLNPSIDKLDRNKTKISKIIITE